MISWGLHPPLKENNYQCNHLHTLLDLRSTMPDYFSDVNKINPETFIKYLEDYKETNNKKMKIVTIIRDPRDRLISSFFQSFHTDEVNFSKISENNTTVMTNDEQYLLDLYIDRAVNINLPGSSESLQEISSIFNINILENLIKKRDYYYFDHILFELFVLDFKQVVKDDKYSTGYLNKCLNINCKTKKNTNLSRDKLYYEKYTNIKKQIPEKVNDIIKLKYNSILLLF